MCDKRLLAQINYERIPTPTYYKSIPPAGGKLLSIRLTFGVVFLSIYPVLLLTSIKWSNYFVVAVTAWCIAMYVDDLMVLNKIIEYPERGLIAIIQSIRPILILSLIWMSFELSIKSSVER